MVSERVVSLRKCVCALEGLVRKLELESLVSCWYGEREDGELKCLVS